MRSRNPSLFLYWEWKKFSGGQVLLLVFPIIIQKNFNIDSSKQVSEKEKHENLKTFLLGHSNAEGIYFLVV